jgi:hypothetical protein
MSTRRVSLVLALLASPSLCGAGALIAQSSAPAGWQATPASVLKSALRSVSAAQERYRAAHGVYAPSVDRLDVRPEYGIRVEILLVGPKGWQAKATHASQPGRSCVVFVGAQGDVEAPRTDADHEMAGEEGIPLCDRMQ